MVEKSIFEKIQKPTLLLDTVRVHRNLACMTQRANRQNVRFRPHFKTHQSAVVGSWFRDYGINQITVSSVDMAIYFADNGWDDITIAFPVNYRQIDAINALANRIKLNLLVESSESVQFLKQNLRVKNPVDVWMKIDVGFNRTGLLWENMEKVSLVAEEIVGSAPEMHLQGLLTHAGQTYRARSVGAVFQSFALSIERINQIASLLRQRLDLPLEISIGDTPGCAVSEKWGAVDEARPGNFIFYDAQQLLLGSCTEDQIAMVVACPVVAKHDERSEIVIYGGAVHLSKDFFILGNERGYGLISLPNKADDADSGISPVSTSRGWGKILPGAYMSSISQEHGLVRMNKTDYNNIAVGDILCIVPAHSCLTAQSLKRYHTLDGDCFDMMPNIG